MRQLLSLRRSLIAVRFSSYSISSQATISHEPPNPVAAVDSVDITIAGGGLVGSAMALALGKDIVGSSSVSSHVSLSLFTCVQESKDRSSRIPSQNSVRLENTTLQQSRLCSQCSIHRPFSKYPFRTLAELRQTTLLSVVELGAWDLMKSIRVQKIARMQVEPLPIIRSQSGTFYSAAGLGRVL